MAALFGDGIELSVALEPDARSDGLTALGRWHAPGSTRGWLLCEAEDPVAVAHHVAEWAGLLKIDAYAVLDDAGAGEAAARARAS